MQPIRLNAKTTKDLIFCYFPNALFSLMKNIQVLIHKFRPQIVKTTQSIDRLIDWPVFK